MAESLVRSWWARFRGRLQPTACPYSDSGALETPLRALVASPRRVLDAFGLGQGDCALEIGPGVGYYSVAAARRVGTRGRLLCLDLQDEMLRETGRRLDSAHLRNADLIRASATHLPLKSGSLDHVFLIAVLGEIPDRPRALAEIRRVLRPRGYLSISEQLPDPDFVTKRALRRELSTAGFSEQRTGGCIFYTSTWGLSDSDAKAENASCSLPSSF